MFTRALVTFWLSLTLASTLLANPKIKQRVEEANHFTVKVVVENGETFFGMVSKGHGTGFIVELTDDEGIVFTNRHVVIRQPWQAQQVKLEFRDGTKGAASLEAIPAEVMFKSGLLDFAVLRFKRSELSPALNAQLQTARLATNETYPKLSLAGGEVVAVGNPLQTESVVTSGIITNQAHRMPWAGDFLQTSAAINPGNSGGPLIDLDTGEVLGICTMKMNGAEAMGFALPIVDAFHEFQLLKQNPDHATRKHLPFLLHPVSIEQVRAAGLEQAINDHFPTQRVFQTNQVLHYVVGLGPDVDLQPHDLVLTAEGQFVSGFPFLLRKLAQHSSKPKITLEVLREGKVVKVDVPFVKDRANGNGNFEFVTFSGAFFADLDPFDALTLGHVEGGVRMFGFFPGTFAQEAFQTGLGGILVGLEYNGQVTEIKSIADLKAVLRKLPQGSHTEKVKLFFLANLQANMGNGMAVTMPGQRRDRRTTVIVPVAFLMDDEMLDFPNLRRSFDFTGFERPETRMGLQGLWACAQRIAGENR